MNTQMKKLILSRNQTGPGRGIGAPCQPPKNRITMSADISTKISEREDKSYATQVYVKATIGATRLEKGKVVKVSCQI